MYSAMCWCEIIMYYSLFYFVLSASFESMHVMFCVYIYNDIVIAVH